MRYSGQRAGFPAATHCDGSPEPHLKPLAVQHSRRSSKHVHEPYTVYCIGGGAVTVNGRLERDVCVQSPLHSCAMAPHMARRPVRSCVTILMQLHASSGSGSAVHRRRSGRRRSRGIRGQCQQARHPCLAQNPPALSSFSLLCLNIAMQWSVQEWPSSTGRPLHAWRGSAGVQVCVEVHGQERRAWGP